MEVMQVSGNHRVSENAEERERILAAGGKQQGKNSMCLLLLGIGRLATLHADTSTSLSVQLVTGTMCVATCQAMVFDCQR